MSQASKLVAFDTDRIKEYIFATDTLKEIRGASALLDRLNRREMSYWVKQADPNRKEIYAHGGAGLFLIEASRAEIAQLAVEHAYRRRTGGAASMTGASVGLPAGFDTERDPVQSLFGLLQLRLRRAKDHPPPALAVTSLPHLRPCDACAAFPATASVPEHGETHLLCDACQRRRQPTRGLWRRLSQMGLPPGQQPEDFNELGKLSKPQGYIGLIYADGNGIGQEIEQLTALADIRRFAQTVDAAIHQATGDAIRSHLLPVNSNLPYELLLLGGDDLVMVTRAQSAIDVAIKLVEKFGEHTERSPIGRRLSLSASVVLAHANFPFRAMLDLAESALKFAKREAAKRRLGDRSLINFVTVTSANHVDFKTFYEATLTVQSQPHLPKLLRSLRPYTPADLRSLLNVARALRDAPRNKLHALGESVFLSHSQSLLDGMTTLRRWRGNAQEGRQVEQVRALEALMSHAGAGETFFPWRRTAQEWRTPLLDLVELFDFVKDG